MELFIFSDDNIMDLQHFIIEGNYGYLEIPLNTVVDTTGDKFITLEKSESTSGYLEIPLNNVVDTTDDKFITLNKKITNWELYKEGDINWLL